MFKISILPEEIENLPLGSFPGQIYVIDKIGLEFLRAIAYLRVQKILGFDTETRPVFSPGQHHNHVALLQLSGPRKAFLFRVGTVGMPKLLCKLMANPRILKVGAAVHDDVRGLQYYQRFKAQGFVDLQKIAFEWGIRDKSVKKLAANVLGLRISKSQQLSNWEAESLSAGQQMYAATDAWVCREMYLKLLQCEKHPLTPEQLNPPQPQPQCQPQSQQPAESQPQAQRTQQPRQPKAAAPAAGDEEAKPKPKRRRRRHRRSRSKKVQEALVENHG